MRLQDLTREIKEKESEVEALRAADRTAYKTYVRARTKLMSKKYRNMEDEGTKKWYNLWIRCADELQALAVSNKPRLRESVEAVRLMSRRRRSSEKKASL